MKLITIHYTRKIVFGEKAFDQFVQDLASSNFKNIFIISIEEILPLIEYPLKALEKQNKKIVFDLSLRSEPTYKDFNRILQNARQRQSDVVIGIGGGSSLDVAKLVAAQLKNDQSLKEIIGIGKLNTRRTPLICLPTTSGTGSEVSPNAILLDEVEQLKKGVVSPHLMPDASYIDPWLTHTMPPLVTASTGVDALTHCIEAYTNKFAHPIIDVLVLEGIRLIGKNLITAVKDGQNMPARSALSLGSMYGGMALGPVNTAAVHALSYPLGGEFHIPHGVSNAVLLPYVMQFNIPVSVERYAKVARALGVKEEKNKKSMAEAGVQKIFELLKACNLPTHLSELNIPSEAIDKMARSAIKVTRLLKNNPRPITLEDAKTIYERAF